LTVSTNASFDQRKQDWESERDRLQEKLAAGLALLAEQRQSFSLQCQEALDRLAADQALVREEAARLAAERIVLEAERLAFAAEPIALQPIALQPIALQPSPAVPQVATLEVALELKPAPSIPVVATKEPFAERDEQTILVMDRLDGDDGSRRRLRFILAAAVSIALVVAVAGWMLYR
jgi:hypothetical protein